MVQCSQAMVSVATGSVATGSVATVSVATPQSLLARLLGGKCRVLGAHRRDELVECELRMRFAAAARLHIDEGRAEQRRVAVGRVA
eukprot:scaffold69983_cov39-Phaeocystis_antarctica.AAC.2